MRCQLCFDLVYFSNITTTHLPPPDQPFICLLSFFPVTMCILNVACSLFPALNAALPPYSLSMIGKSHTPAALLRNQVISFTWLKHYLSLSLKVIRSQFVISLSCKTYQHSTSDLLPAADPACL